MQDNAHNELEKKLAEHEKTIIQLREGSKELMRRQKELEKHETCNAKETQKLELEKLMDARASLEQKMEKDVLMLAEMHKKEQQKLKEILIELEKQISAKEALELGIQFLKGVVQEMKHVDTDLDEHVKQKLMDMQQALQEKEEEMGSLAAYNQFLIVEERMCNEELREARKELITGLMRFPSRTRIGVKRMGELDREPFKNALKGKLPEDEMEIKALQLWSEWQERIQDPVWHPFKIVQEEDGGHLKEVIEDDELLTRLKEEYGNEVYKEVTKSLKEINEYNASGRYVLSELWNFREERKASLKEGIQHLWRQLKQKRTRDNSTVFKTTQGQGLYGWLARANDYRSSSIFGNHLRKKGDLKTVTDVGLEGKQKNSSVVSHLIEERQNELEKILSENEKRNIELGERYEEFIERQKLDLEKLMNARVNSEQKKMDEDVLMLVETHKKEQQKLQERIIELEKQIDAKQGDVQVMKQKLMDKQQELQEKEEERKDLEDVYHALIVRERKSNDELQQARQEFIAGFTGVSSRTLIGLKRMGELDPRPFKNALKEKLPKKEIDLKALELCSEWQEHIKDPNWHPFKIVPAEDGGHLKEVIEDDELLTRLKEEYGNEVYKEVTKALKEIDEYNASGRYVVSEVWNFREDRKASMKEGIQHLWRQLKRKRI